MDEQKSFELTLPDNKKYHTFVLEILKLFAKNQTTFKKFNINLINKKYLDLNEENIEDLIPSNLTTEFRFSSQNNFQSTSMDLKNFLRFYTDEDFFTTEYNITNIFLNKFEDFKDKYVFHNGLIKTFSSELDFKDKYIKLLILKKPDECKTSKFLCDNFPKLKKKYKN